MGGLEHFFKIDFPKFAPSSSEKHDDTLIIAKNTQTAKEYLKYIEEESEYYNIKLNRDKCVCITYNKNNQITFADGQAVKNVEETVYLGTQINKKVDPTIEINQRISSTMPVLKRLDLFWKQAQVPTKWKIQVFNAVCVSKLLYSLEALQPTEAAAKKLDTFQLKGPRKFFRMHTVTQPTSTEPIPTRNFTDGPIWKWAQAQKKPSVH